MTHAEPAVPDPWGGGFVRVRLDVAYDGNAFAGWARQPRLRTVQGQLEQTLATVLRVPEPPSTTCAGRTDAGVHARGQVVHVDLPAALWAATGPETLLKRLAGALPRDLRVHTVAAAPEGFDARFSATWRRYVYRVCDHPSGPDPVRRHEVLWHPRPLYPAALQAAADLVVGQHDFAAFCRRREGATTVRVLQEFGWARAEPRGAAGCAVLEATVVADAFCHSMVRSLVGACLAVGEGRRDAAWMAGVLAGRARVPDVQVVGPQGLTLEQVGYPVDAELAAQAVRARRRRGPA